MAEIKVEYNNKKVVKTTGVKGNITQKVFRLNTDLSDLKIRKMVTKGLDLKYLNFKDKDDEKLYNSLVDRNNRINRATSNYQRAILDVSKVDIRKVSNLDTVKNSEQLLKDFKFNLVFKSGLQADEVEKVLNGDIKFFEAYDLKLLKKAIAIKRLTPNTVYEYIQSMKK